MPKVGPDGEPTDDQPQQRDQRPELVAPTIELADRIMAALPADVLNADCDLRYRAMLTAAHRLSAKTNDGRICRGKQRV